MLHRESDCSFGLFLRSNKLMERPKADQEKEEAWTERFKIRQ